MDLQVYAVIAIVFLVSLCSLLFINKQFRGGKTFEDVLEEKRQFAEKLYGPRKKTTKKPATGKKNRDRTSSKNNQEKQSPKQATIVESDGKSDSSSEYDVNANNENEQQPKFHVEFTEAEIIASDTNTVAFKRQLSTGKLPTQPVRKTSTNKPPGSSILVNKTCVSSKNIIPSANGVTETLNHFDKIHPKDVLEMKRNRDDSISGVSNVSTGSRKDNKKGTGKQHNKKDGGSPLAHAEKQSNAFNDAVDNHLIVPADVIVNAAIQKESPKNVPNKEKSNKKKRNDALLVQQLIDAGVASSTTDEVNVNAIMTLLGRTELTRSEIQILIDFLLNKQQDTASVVHSDWSDDLVHKVRKQLEEKDRQLAEEQTASLALHTKLREMRAEWNNERVQTNHKLQANGEELNALKIDLHQTQQELQLTTERYATEKQALNTQLQHLQQKLFQEKNAQSQETAQKLQQVTDTNAQYAAELSSKNNLILQIRDESLKKIAEYEQKFQECVRQSEADVAHLTTENHNLRAECQRKDEYEKLFAIQKYDLEQLEARMSEQSKTSNQMDDNSKVEIRNLQNALDSSKTELALRGNDLLESTKRINELSAQLAEFKNSFDAEKTAIVQKYAKQVEELNGSIQSYQTLITEKDQTLNEYKTKLENASADQREQELFKEIANYKEKNNELRKKNWKLVDALQKVEESAFKISSKCNLVATNVATLSPSPTKKSTPNENEQIVRTKQVFDRLFPNVPSNVDYDAWLTNLSKHIEILVEQKQQNVDDQPQNKHKNNNSNSSVSNNHHNNDVDNKITGNGNHLNDENANGAKTSTEELILQNAKLKTTVDEYKSIVAETEGLLKHLEKRVKEQDVYWRDVVQSKDSEISSLHQNNVQST